MKRLQEYFKDNCSYDKDCISESFNTTLYTYFNEEQEISDNDSKCDLQIINDFNSILTDNSIKMIQKAEKIDTLVRKRIKLGENWKFKAIKDDSGHVFIALRQTTKLIRPYNLSVNVTASRIAFLNTDENQVFVYGGDNKDIWDDERKEIVKQVLSLLGCVPNNDSQGFEYTMGKSEKLKDESDSLEDSQSNNNDDNN